MDLLLGSENGASTLVMQRQADSHGTKFIGTERVKVTTLNKVLESAGVLRVDFLFIGCGGP